MNVNYHCDELISEIVMKFEETQEQFIFQTISDFTSNVYQIEIDKQELIDAITLIRKSRGADIIFKDPKIRLGYCDNCPEFDAHVEKDVLFAGHSKKYFNTNITCEHKDKCRCLKDMIEKETKKRND